MSPLVILITIAAYLAVLFFVSWIAGRNADNAGFFSGNRQSNWIIVAMSTIGAAISGVTFVSVPGMVQGAGFSYMQMVLGFTVGQILVAYVLIPFLGIHRKRAHAKGCSKNQKSVHLRSSVLCLIYVIFGLQRYE